MLVAAAVCPCPPLLVPEVAAGAAPELDELRAACADVVGVLAASRPDRLVVIGPAAQSDRGPYPQGASGSFRRFGVDSDVTLGSPRPGSGESQEAATRPLPASLAVGAWLLRDWSASPVEGLGVEESLQPERCAAVGAMIAKSAERVALLVLGDGSACRTVKAPGYLDERAEPFDASVSAALAAADTATLASLDPELAKAVQAAGRSCWQVLAGAAEGAGLSGELLHNDAPYGVGYFVAAWT